MNYTQHFSTKQTPQNQPIPNSGQVENSAGGYVYALDKWQRLTQFIILGTEGGSYYANEHNLTVENAQVVLECLKESGIQTLTETAAISQAGRAMRNDPALFVLALAFSPKFADKTTRSYAKEVLPKIARSSTDLFKFLNMVTEYRGWGPALRKAVINWYTEKGEDGTAYQMVKYRGGRYGWTHKDVISLAHPNPQTSIMDDLYAWAVTGKVSESLAGIKIFDGFYRAQNTQDEDEIVSLIKEYKLPHEAVPKIFHNSVAVWTELSKFMNMGALLRELPRLTRLGVLSYDNHERVSDVVKTLKDHDLLRLARIHPVSMLTAWRTYSNGRSQYATRNAYTWQPLVQVIDALEEGFYRSFETLEPTGKRTVLAIDMSGSMREEISGLPITCREAAMLMAMVTARTEDWYQVYGFTGRYLPLNITAKSSFRELSGLAAVGISGVTDCAVPMLWAKDHNIPVDTFAVYTDNETWAGNIHPVQALDMYQQKMGIHAKLAVVGMVSNGFSIADPARGDMMDFVGFDTQTPRAIAEFSNI